MPPTDAADKAETADSDDTKTPPSEPDWKARARQWEQRAKDNADAAKRLAQLEEAGKTEAQKQADQLAALTKRAEEAETRALRLEVAALKGLTPGQAKRLAGATREELEADADELLTEFKPADSKTPVANRRPVDGTKPTPDDGTPPAEETDPAKLADAVFANALN